MLIGLGIAEAGRRWQFQQQCANGQCSIQQTTQYTTAPAAAKQKEATAKPAVEQKASSLTEVAEIVAKHEAAIRSLNEKLAAVEHRCKDCTCAEKLNATATDSASWQMLKAHPEHPEPDPVTAPVIHAVEAIDSFVANLTQPHEDSGWSAMRAE